MTIHDTGEIVITQDGPGRAYHIPEQDVADHGTAAALAADLEAAGAARATTVRLITDDDGTPLYAATVAALASIRPPSPPGETTLPGYDPAPLQALLGLAGRHAADEPPVLPPGMADAVRDGVLSGDLPWNPDRANAALVRQYAHTGPDGGEAA